jgi:hypothetical protein
VYLEVRAGNGHDILEALDEPSHLDGERRGGGCGME